MSNTDGGLPILENLNTNFHVCNILGLCDPRYSYKKINPSYFQSPQQENEHVFIYSKKILKSI